MDAERRTDLPVRLGVRGGDTPVSALLRTPHVDEARMYLRSISYDTVKLLPREEPQRFAFDSSMVQLGPFTVGEISFGAGVRLQAPDLGSSYHVVMKEFGVMRSRHRQREILVDSGIAAVYGPVGEIQTDWQPGCRMLIVRIDRVLLEQEVALATGLPRTHVPAVECSFDLRHGSGRSWASLVRLFQTELRSATGMLSEPRLAQRWWRLLLSGLATTLELPSADAPIRYDLGLRPRPVKRALDAMHADPGRTFTVTDLAEIAGISARVLQEAFRRHVGTPPMTYLRDLRLGEVHKELSRSDARQVTVSEVAFRWGFAHLGRFAGAYRQRFGVSPSHTLRHLR